MKLMKNIAALFIILTVLAMMLPKLFPFRENTDFSPNYRIPYELGEDYYLYEMYCQSIPKTKETIILLGDSVIWGHYVERNESLSAQMNKLPGKASFYNAGIDGIHPAAMAGLIEHYGKGLKNRKIILGINLLWLSSSRHDLTGEINNEINHRSLLNQFSHEIPSYHAPVEDKIARVMQRSIPFLAWSLHLKKTVFQNESFYRWSMNNPGESPFDFFSCRRLNPFRAPEKFPGKNIKNNVKWVPLSKSYQWSQIKKIMEELHAGNNRVFVLMTPYNTHSLGAESLKKYKNLVKGITQWLKQKSIPYFSPQRLSAPAFKDASHTGKEGYRTIAEELIENRSFKDFMKQ